MKFVIYFLFTHYEGTLNAIKYNILRQLIWISVEAQNYLQINNFTLLYYNNNSHHNFSFVLKVYNFNDNAFVKREENWWKIRTDNTHVSNMKVEKLKVWQSGTPFKLRKIYIEITCLFLGKAWVTIGKLKQQFS